VAAEGFEDALDAPLEMPPGHSGATAPSVVEAVLTEGYATALELEAERSRLLKQLERDAPPREAQQLRAVMAAVGRKLARLRRRLDEANRRHRGSRQHHLNDRSRAGGGPDHELAP
jgi:hypothetical protein